MIHKKEEDTQGNIDDDVYTSLWFGQKKYVCLLSHAEKN